MTWLPGGHKDWFSVNVSQTNFQFRINRSASVLYQNFDDAADQAAQLLYQEWGDRPLYIALSGGVDSELTARIFVKNNIPFTPVIVKIDGLNNIETWYAEYWCHINNITPIILNYSIKEIIDHTARLSAKLTQIKNYLMTTVLLFFEHVQRLGGYGIFSAGDINLNTDRKQFYCASLDFLTNVVNAGSHPTAFFMYTPEIALSYVYQFDVDQTEQYNKLKFYQVSPRPKIAYLDWLGQIEEYKKIISQLHYIFKLDNDAINYQKHWYWYGTKEELMQKLQP
jgi:hypothetical protein